VKGDPNAYRFVSVWPVGADPDSTYTALYEVVEYAQWWPEVREARRLDERRVRLRTRSLLPYDITFTLCRTITDPVERVLEASIDGDIEGSIRWTITPGPDGGGSSITWDQRVVARKRLLRLFAPLGRPAFRVNHALMMRSGRSGLRVFLAGYRLGTTRHTRDGG